MDQATKMAQDNSEKVAAAVGGIAGQVSAGPQARSLCTSTTAHHHHTTTFPLYDQPCFSPGLQAAPLLLPVPALITGLQSPMAT